MMVGDLLLVAEVTEKVKGRGRSESVDAYVSGPDLPRAK